MEQPELTYFNFFFLIGGGSKSRFYCFYHKAIRRLADRKLIYGKISDLTWGCVWITPLGKFGLLSSYL